MAQALAERGLTEADVKKAALASRRRPSLAEASAERKYPRFTKEWASYKLGPALVENEDGQFSAAQLTREYVEKFCLMNNLTR